MAYMNRARPAGFLAADTDGPASDRMRIAAKAAMRTALGRPPGTRNGAPSYRNDVGEHVERRIGRGRSLGTDGGGRGGHSDGDSEDLVGRATFGVARRLGEGTGYEPTRPRTTPWSLRAERGEE